jgi:hypothetical protein
MAATPRSVQLRLLHPRRDGRDECVGCALAALWVDAPLGGRRGDGDRRRGDRPPVTTRPAPAGGLGARAPLRLGTGAAHRGRRRRDPDALPPHHQELGGVRARRLPRLGEPGGSRGRFRRNTRRDHGTEGSARSPTGIGSVAPRRSARSRAAPHGDRVPHAERAHRPGTPRSVVPATGGGQHRLSGGRLAGGPAARLRG